MGIMKNWIQIQKEPASWNQNATQKKSEKDGTFVGADRVKHKSVKQTKI